jgi:hypothetical protein
MIINLTQHPGTPEQGVVDLTGQKLAALKVALTFDTLPTPDEIIVRAEFIAELACYNGLGGDDGEDPTPTAAMIGGAPYLMAALERALLVRSIFPLYAFSVRDSAEQVQADGTVRKVAIFRHYGFVRGK